MSDIVGRVECECGAKLDESPHQAIEDRLPCAMCGSRNRKVFAHFESTVEPYSTLSLKGKPAVGKWFINQLTGTVRQHSGVLMHVTRVIDRAKDWYHERVVNPKTGEVVHECSEPLSEHRGHGHDRPK